jgi:Protein of unknown function (DUF2568)
VQPLSIARSIALTLRFVLELCLLTAVAVWGWHTAGGGAPGVALAVAAAVAVAVIWGALVAPRAARRLSDPHRLLLECAIFAAGGLGLSAAGRTTAGITLAVGSTVVAGLVRALGGEPVPPS